MGDKLIRLAGPLIVFLVLLKDIEEELKVYQDTRNIKKFKFARILIVIALVLTIVLGLVDIFKLNINKDLIHYLKIYNLLVLIAYLLFTRFKRT